MEKAFGKVLSITNDLAVVGINRGTMCGENCSSCGMCEKGKTKIKAKNSIGAKAGDSVVLSVSVSDGLKAAMLVYGIPVIILVLSVVLFLNAGFSEKAAVVFSFLIMSLWFFCIFLAEKTGLFKKYILAEIIEIRKKSGNS